MTGAPSARSVEDLVALRQRHVERQRLEAHLKQDARQHGAGKHVPEAQPHVGQQVVDRDEEEENGCRREDQRQQVGHPAISREARRQILEEGEADGADDEPREERDQGPDHDRDRNPFSAEKRPVRSAVDDVERRFEDTEERERRPREEHAPNQAQGGGVVLDVVDHADDLRDRSRGQDVLQLPDEVRGLVCPAEKAEESEREKDERHEREQREVGDHRGQVRPAVREKLAKRLAHRRSMFPT